MRQTLDVLNALVADGVVARYAIGGAVATYQYVEATVTEDLDILVSFEADRRSGLVVLTPILNSLATRGYTEFRHEGVLIEGWPVQFLPVADDLDAESLAAAREVTITIPPDDTSVTTYVLTPEHLVATALKVGRPKDRTRIVQFVEEQAVAYDVLCPLLDRHGLADRWRAFCGLVGLSDPCSGGAKSP